MIKWRYFIVTLLLVVASCKHDPFTDRVAEFELSAPEFIYTSDSVLLSKTPASWTLNPNIGEVTSGNYYKAPSTLLTDSQQVTITANTTVQSRSKKILILKRDAFDTVISFTKTIMPLMVGNCNFRGCHGNGSKGGRVDLSTYEATVNSLTKYQPGKSILYLSLLKTDPLRRMPPAGTLHEYRIAYFKKWIEQGAVNN